LTDPKRAVGGPSDKLPEFDGALALDATAVDDAAAAGDLPKR
jgi:hypothetical protein